MFDIGFWELIAIAVVALLIIGPERLPQFARDAGRFVGKIRRMIQSAKRELEKELDLDERGDLKNSINHIDKLMKEAPDRVIMGDQEKKTDK